MSHFDVRNRRSRFKREFFSLKNVSETKSELNRRFTIVGTFKSSPIVVSPEYFSHKRPLFVGACSLCNFHSGTSLVNPELTTLLPLKNSLSEKNVDIFQLQDTSNGGSRSDLNTSQIEKFIIANPFVQESVKLQEGQEISHPLEKLQELLFINFQPKSWATRILNFFGKKILQILFPRGIIYHSGQLEVLRRASQAGSPLIFFHKGESILDAALVMSVLNYQVVDLAVNTVSTFERSDFWNNLKMRLFGIQSSFELFTDETSDLDWSVQNALIQYLLSNGRHLLLNPASSETCFSPIMNLLYHLIEILSIEGLVEDVQVVPVSISYDQTLEEKGIHEFSIWRLVKAWLDIEPFQLGLVRVDFDQPFSLREFLNSCDKNRIDISPQLFCVDHIKWNISRLHSFSSVELLAFILTYKFADADQIEISELLEAFTNLYETLLRKKNLSIGFSGDLSKALSHALQMIAPHIEISPGATKLNIRQESKDFFIRKSRNVVHAFFSEAVLSVAVGSLVKIPVKNYIGTNMPIVFDEEKLHHRSELLFSLLQHEFSAWSPCKSFDENFNSGLEELVLQEIVVQKNLEEESSHFQDRKARRLARMIEMDGLESSRNDQVSSRSYNLILKSERISKLVFFQSLLTETLARYWRVFVQLPELVEIESMEKSIFLDLFQNDSSSEIQIVIDQLLSLGIVEDSYTEIKLAEPWKSCKSVNHLIAQMNKFVLSVPSKLC